MPGRNGAPFSLPSEQELEQALVAVEDARAEAAALAADLDRVTHELQWCRDDLRRAREALDRLRAEREREAVRQQQAVERANVLAEELRLANEELQASNEELEERVAERTVALAKEVVKKETALRDRELMMAEVYHQIGNSLQIMRSIMNLHAAATPDPATRQQFREAAMRVQAIAAVHHRLYADDGRCVSAGVPVSAYLEGLVQDVWSATLSEPTPSIVLSIEPDLVLPASRMVAVGLVVTELVTNAFKYGGGRVQIGVHRAQADTVEVTVADDGPGFPPDFDLKRCRSLGMRVVQAYAVRPDGVRLDRAAKGGRVIVVLAT
jgi:two-component sensor histidine kinase